MLDHLKLHSETPAKVEDDPAVTKGATQLALKNTCFGIYCFLS